MNAFQAIFNFLFPKYCISCGIHGHLVCPSCLAQVGTPFEQIQPWILSVWKYRHPTIRCALHALKYKNSHAIAKDIAPYLYDELLAFLEDQLITDREQILLVPIPMTAKKRRQRGFNQSEILTREVAKQNREMFHYTEILLKTRQTIPQARVKQKSKRLTNLRGVFVHKNASQIDGKTIILVDDVTTTGATLTEARKALRRAGAKRVFGITVGH